MSSSTYAILCSILEVPLPKSYLPPADKSHSFPFAKGANTHELELGRMSCTEAERPAQFRCLRSARLTQLKHSLYFRTLSLYDEIPMIACQNCMHFLVLELNTVQDAGPGTVERVSCESLLFFQNVATANAVHSNNAHRCSILPSCPFNTSSFISSGCLCLRGTVVFVVSPIETVMSPAPARTAKASLI